MVYFEVPGRKVNKASVAFSFLFLTTFHVSSAIAQTDLINKAQTEAETTEKSGMDLWDVITGKKDREAVVKLFNERCAKRLGDSFTPLTEKEVRKVDTPSAISTCNPLGGSIYD